MKSLKYLWSISILLIIAVGMVVFVSLNRSASGLRPKDAYRSSFDQHEGVSFYRNDELISTFSMNDWKEWARNHTDVLKQYSKILPEDSETISYFSFASISTVGDALFALSQYKNPGGKHDTFLIVYDMETRDLSIVDTVSSEINPEQTTWSPTRRFAFVDRDGLVVIDVVKKTRIFAIRSRPSESPTNRPSELYDQIRHLFPGIEPIEFEELRWVDDGKKLIFKTNSFGDWDGYGAIKNVEWLIKADGSDLQVKTVDNLYPAVTELAQGPFDCGGAASSIKCYKAIELLVLGGLPLPKDIAEDDEKIKDYLNNTIRPNKVEILRGRFDAPFLQEMIVVIWGYPPAGGYGKHLIVFRKEKTTGEWVGSFQSVSDAREVTIGYEKLVENTPEFFTVIEREWGGMCAPYQTLFSVYRWKYGQFIKILTLPLDELTVDYSQSTETKTTNGYPAQISSLTDFTVNYKDLDGDGNLEIIHSGGTRTCEEFCYDCLTLLHEEKTERIFTWDPQKDTFVELIPSKTQQ